MEHQELWYVFGMGGNKREAAKVMTETEKKKLKVPAVLCGATFYLKAHCYGLLYCKPDDYAHWEAWAKKNSGKIIEWENYKTVYYLYSPNRKEIARREIVSDKFPSQS